MGITGMTIKTECCQHRAGRALWIKNDGNGPPVLFWESFEAPQASAVVLTLTNQTIYANCPTCFSTKRATPTATLVRS